MKRFAHTTLALAVLAAFLVVGVVPASAQSCAPYPVVEQRLSEGFSEVKRGVGLAGADRLVELWFGADGSWTMLVVTPQGIACVVASGRHWSDLPAPVALEGEPS